MSIIDELKPYMVRLLHERRLQSYKEEFKRHNSGKEPTSVEINAFVVHMVATGTIDREALELAGDFVKEARRLGQKKNIFVNTAFTVPSAGILILFIFVIIGGQVPDYLKSGTGFYGTIVTAILLLLVLVIATVLNLHKKDK